MTNPEVHVALKMSADRERRVVDDLRSHGFAPHLVNTRQLLEQLGDIEYLIIGRPPRIDWSPARRLRLLHVAGAGVDPLFPALGLRPEVEVTNSRGAHADLVRDHAVALLLALFRDLPRAFGQQTRREWRSYPTESVAGKQLCIVGLGEIGGRVATIATALGMRVSGVCRNPRSVPGVARVVGPGQLREVLADADAVVLCLPLTSETRHLIDAEVIDALPDGVRLVNVSRGAIVDEVALERAVRLGKLTAALDVFDTEPLPPNSTLWDCPGLIVSPHVAGFAADYLDGVLASFLDSVAALRSGGVPPTRVQRDREY